jgi:hypothetical protein
MSVKIFGHTLSTPAATAIAGGSGLAVYFAYKQHKASQAGSGASNPSAIDPVTGLPYSQDNVTDPLTGQTYLAEAQQYGSVAAAEQATAASSSASLQSAYGGSYGGGYGYGSSTGLVGSSGTTQISSGGYASNAAWAQAVTAGLTNLGYTSTDISAALGLYLGGLPLTNLPDGQSAASIVEAALAEYGPPPVGSYTPVMPGSGSTGSGSTGSGTSDGNPPTPTPTPTPTPAPAPKKYAGAISNLRVTGYNHTGVSFAWNRAPNDTGGYAWKLTSVDGQGITKSGNLPSGSTVHSVTGLNKPGVYNFGIQALPGGPGNNIHTPSLKG